MPRYRVLVERPDAEFMDVIIDARDEDDARRIACDMGWETAGSVAALLPVSIAPDSVQDPAPGEAPTPSRVPIPSEHWGRVVSIDAYRDARKARDPSGERT